MKKFIVTISREYGAGGRQAGRKLASALGVPYYDRKIIQMAADKSGMSAEFIESNEQKASYSLAYNISMSDSSTGTMFFGYQTPPGDQAFFAQADVLREVAAEGSCVIIGRCADYVLRDEPGLIRVFLYAPEEKRIERVMREYGIEKDEALKQMRDTDKGRSKYYKLYSGQSWGAVKNYDLFLNTECSGVDGAAEVIKRLAELKSRD